MDDNQFVLKRSSTATLLGPMKYEICDIGNHVIFMTSFDRNIWQGKVDIVVSTLQRQKLCSYAYQESTTCQLPRMEVRNEADSLLGFLVMACLGTIHVQNTSGDELCELSWSPFSFTKKVLSCNGLHIASLSFQGMGDHKWILKIHQPVEIKMKILLLGCLFFETLSRQHSSSMHSSVVTPQY